MLHKPLQLAEQSPPSHVLNCRNCELAGLRTRIVWGEGNPKARIILLLDNPGAREDKDGNPFVCGTRDTLQTGLKESGIDIHDVFITYLLKRRPIRAYDKPLARRLCLAHFQEQLDKMKPALLFGFGNVVVQSLFENEELDVKGLRGRWHDYEGIRMGVSYHPLAVRRRPSLYTYFLQDLRLLAKEVQL